VITPPVVQPEPLYSGGSPAYITIYGYDFGSTRGTGSVQVCGSQSGACTSPISVIYNGAFSQWTSTQINVQLQAPAGTAPGQYWVQVTAGNNAYGQSFTPGAGTGAVTQIRAAVNVQSPPVLTVVVNGLTISSGQVVTLSATSPPITVQANVTNATGTVDYRLHALYTRPSLVSGGVTYPAETFDETYTVAGPFQAGSLWGITKSTGGSLAVEWNLNGTGWNSFPFSVVGTNATKADAVAYLDGEPWFQKLLPGAEGNGNPLTSWRQFINGLPIFGPPHGYGMMQIDPSTTLDLLFDWKVNADKGKQTVQVKKTENIGAWNGYISAWDAYNFIHPDNPAPPFANQSEGTQCVFSMSPSGTQHDFFDAVWIKAYNSNTLGRYLAWDTNTNHWVRHELNSDGLNYVARLCNQIP
jgi:IPT/TIG domain